MTELQLVIKHPVLYIGCVRVKDISLAMRETGGRWWWEWNHQDHGLEEASLQELNSELKLIPLPKYR